MYIISKNTYVSIYFLALSMVGNCIAAEKPDQEHVFDQLLNSSGYVLSLHTCALHDAALCRLSEKLKHNKIITNINLGSNSFSDQGFKALIDALPCTAVTTLTVNSNKITDEGMGYFCASGYANDKDSPLN